MPVLILEPDPIEICRQAAPPNLPPDLAPRLPSKLGIRLKKLKKVTALHIGPANDFLGLSPCLLGSSFLPSGAIP